MAVSPFSSRRYSLVLALPVQLIVRSSHHHVQIGVGGVPRISKPGAAGLRDPTGFKLIQALMPRFLHVPTMQKARSSGVTMATFGVDVGTNRLRRPLNGGKP